MNVTKITKWFNYMTAIFFIIVRYVKQNEEPKAKKYLAQRSM